MSLVVICILKNRNVSMRHMNREMLQNYWMRWNRLIGVYYLPRAKERTEPNRTVQYGILRMVRFPWEYIIRPVGD